MLHAESLTEDAKQLGPKLVFFKEIFYLAGGTALALQLGHRISVDFDLFSADPIKKTLLAQVEEVYVGLPIEVLVNNSRELMLLVHGVKHSFLHYPFEVLRPFVGDWSLPLLSATEILATKAYTIGRRGAYKDYIDIQAGIKQGVSTLQEIIELAREKYGEAFNDRLFLEQLVYLEDVIEDTIIMLDQQLPTKDDLIAFFTGEIKNIVL